MEKVVVEFTVNDREKFMVQLQALTEDQKDGTPAPLSAVGYRADDYVSRREALVAFVNKMEEKLRKNEHKKNWREKPVDALISLMLLEVQEFQVAHGHFAIEESRPELVDIANFALIVWDRLGMLNQESNYAAQEGSKN